MFKLILFVLGAAVGAGAATAWLTSEPESGTASSGIPAETLQPRLEDLKARIQAAQVEGERAGQYTEEHLRRRLDAYRKGAESGTSA
jgi:hypothetical protein